MQGKLAISLGQRECTWIYLLRGFHLTIRLQQKKNQILFTATYSLRVRFLAWVQSLREIQMSLVLADRYVIRATIIERIDDVYVAYARISFYTVTHHVR